MQTSAGRISGALIVLLSVLGPPAAAGPGDADDVQALLAKGRFSPQQSQAVLAHLARAEKRGLPTGVLTNRIREGIARRAEPKAILGVVEDRVANLEKADDVLRRCAQQGIPVRERERSLVRLADSFAEGVTPGDVIDLLPAAKGRGDVENVAHAAEVMGRLERKGFSPDETREVVAAAVAERWPAERMDGLVGVFLEADLLHLSPDETREVLVLGIRERRDGTKLVEKMRQTTKESERGERGKRGHGRDASEERREKGRGRGQSK